MQEDCIREMRETKTRALSLVSVDFSSVPRRIEVNVASLSGKWLLKPSPEQEMERGIL
jgi:hypothetical protein